MDATADPAGLRRTATPTEQPICASCPAIHHLIVQADRAWRHAIESGQRDAAEIEWARVVKLRSILAGNTP